MTTLPPSPYASRFRLEDREKPPFEAYSWHADHRGDNHYPYYEAVNLTQIQANRLAASLYSLGIEYLQSPTHPADHSCSIIVEGHKDVAVLLSGKSAQGWAKDFIMKSRTAEPTEFNAHQHSWPNRPNMRNHLLHEALQTLGVPFEHQKDTKTGRDVYVIPAEYAERFAPKHTEQSGPKSFLQHVEERGTSPAK